MLNSLEVARRLERIMSNICVAMERDLPIISDSGEAYEAWRAHRLAPICAAFWNASNELRETEFERWDAI